MDPVLKEERREMKRLKEHYDRLEHVADAHFGIPTSCPCGGRIVDEVSYEEASDFLPGKRFFKYNNYKNDGLHFRQPWVLGVQQEIWWVKQRVEEVEKLTWKFEIMNNQIKYLKEENERLTKRVGNLENNK